VRETGAEELRRRIDLVRSVAPHAVMAILIDRGVRGDGELGRLTDFFRALGVTLHRLPVNELEDFWLDPALLPAVVESVAAEAFARRGELVPLPPAADINAVLVEVRRANADLKGSSQLEKVCQRFHLSANKTLVARVAMNVIQTRAPHILTAILDTVRAVAIMTMVSSRAACQRRRRT
jgi:hypothetical protein